MSGLSDYVLNFTEANWRRYRMSKSQRIGEQQAFPRTYSEGGSCEGMTYRQWLVGMVVQGMCGNPYMSEPMTSMAQERGKQTAEMYAIVAIEHADAVLAELAKE